MKIHYIMIRGHSKITFVEGRGRGSLKSKQKRTGEGGRLSICLRSLFKQNAEIFKMKFYSYSPVFHIDYNGNMKY